MARASLSGAAALALVIALGCSGLSGPGKEFGSTDVYDEEEFLLTFTTESERAYEVWLEYDLAYYAADWKLAGPLMMQVGENSAGRWKVEFRSDGPPVVGVDGRVVVDGKRVLENDGARATGTIFLVALPSQPADTQVTLTGMLTSDDDTELRGARLVVTN